MPPLTLSATPPEGLWLWLVMAGFGVYHGLNPGMGWLFALALGLQQQSEKAIWRSLVPIALGKVNMYDLFAWSFLMALAHGAGLMVAPSLVSLASLCDSPHLQLSVGAGLSLAVGIYTVAMIAVMAVVAMVVYKKLGLTVLRQNWINFDLIWAMALLLVGGIALLTVF